MDVIRTTCPHCEEPIEAPAHLAGQTSACPHCEQLVELPTAEGAEEPSTPARRSRSSRLVEERPRTENFGFAVGAAALGAVLGALVWAGVAYFTQFEIGWLAIGVGALTGGLAWWAGGRGTQVAMVAAAMAAIGIVGGKYLGYQFATAAEIDRTIEEDAGRDLYDELMEDARQFAALEEPVDETTLREFMVVRDYVDTSDPSEISPDQLTAFTEQQVPLLEHWAGTEPGFEEWQAARRESMEQYFATNLSPWQLMLDDFHPLDILFLVLGIAAAWQIVESNTQKERVQAARARRTT